MARLEITSPDPALCGTVARVVFTDGKAWVDALSDGQRALLERRGFTVTERGDDSPRELEDEINSPKAVRARGRARTKAPAIGPDSTPNE